MKSLALDLLKEELAELESKGTSPTYSYVSTRMQHLRYAIQELKNTQDLVQLKNMSIRTHEKEINTDCKACRYNHNQEELSELNEEEYINAFDKCRSCKNYYPNNFEEK